MEGKGIKEKYVTGEADRGHPLVTADPAGNRCQTTTRSTATWLR
jgi:hypothetical protein